MAEEANAMKAVPALATGDFHERPAAPPLRESFACTWVHKMQDAGAPPIIVTPDGTIDLQWVDGAFRVAGPDKDPQIEILPAGATIVGFRFHPAAAATWLRVSVTDLLGQRPMLDQLWGSRARRLAGGVRGQQGIAALVSSLEAILVQCGAASTVDWQMRAAYELIAEGPPPGAPLIPWLMRALAISERTLRRRFDETFGYGPKTLDRILRYQRFLRLARAGRGSTALLAAEAGYSDQAHLVRESQRLTRKTPLQFERMLSASRNTKHR